MLARERRELAVGTDSTGGFERADDGGAGRDGAFVEAAAVGGAREEERCGGDIVWGSAGHDEALVNGGVRWWGV